MKKMSIFIVACTIALLFANLVNAQKKVESKSKPAGNVTVQTERVSGSTGQTTPPASSISGTTVKSLPPRPTPASAGKSSGGAKTSGNAN